MTTLNFPNFPADIDADVLDSIASVLAQMAAHDVHTETVRFLTEASTEGCDSQLAEFCSNLDIDSAGLDPCLPFRVLSNVTVEGRELGHYVITPEGRCYPRLQPDLDKSKAPAPPSVAAPLAFLEAEEQRAFCDLIESETVVLADLRLEQLQLERDLKLGIPQFLAAMQRCGITAEEHPIFSSRDGVHLDMPDATFLDIHEALVTTAPLPGVSVTGWLVRPDCMPHPAWGGHYVITAGGAVLAAHVHHEDAGQALAPIPTTVDDFGSHYTADVVLWALEQTLNRCGYAIDRDSATQPRLLPRSPGSR